MKMFCNLLMEQPLSKCKASDKLTEEDFGTFNARY